MPKFFPAWYLEKEHDLVRSAASGLRASGVDKGLGTWPFNTNATYTAGMQGIPTIGFGPSRENLAHTVDEYIELNALFTSAEAYLSMINHILM